jgi:hypothetical protein
LSFLFLPISMEILYPFKTVVILSTYHTIKSIAEFNNRD